MFPTSNSDSHLLQEHDIHVNTLLYGTEDQSVCCDTLVRWRVTLLLYLCRRVVSFGGRVGGV